MKISTSTVYDENESNCEQMETVNINWHWGYTTIQCLKNNHNAWYDHTFMTEQDSYICQVDPLI